MNTYTSEELLQLTLAIRQRRQDIAQTRDAYDQLAAAFTSGTREQADAWLTGKGWRDRSQLQARIDLLDKIDGKLIADDRAESRAELDAITERRKQNLGPDLDWAICKYDGVPADTGSL